jgi:hypothetical protein
MRAAEVATRSIALAISSCPAEGKNRNDVALQELFDKVSC